MGFIAFHLRFASVLLYSAWYCTERPDLYMRLYRHIRERFESPADIVAVLQGTFYTLLLYQQDAEQIFRNDSHTV